MRKMLFSTHLLDRRARAILPTWELDPQVEYGIDALLEAAIGFDGISEEHAIAVDGRRVVCKTHAINLAATEIAALCCDQCRIERHRLARAIGAAAVGNNVDVVTLGALTPGVVRNGLRTLRGEGGAPIVVTTGSAYTAYAAVRAALRDPSGSSSDRFAVVGAFGGVGASCWQLIAEAAVTGEPVAGLTLLYRPGANALNKTARRLKSIVTRWGGTGLAPVVDSFERRSSGTREPAAIIDSFASAVDEVIGSPGWTQITASDDSHALRSAKRLLIATNQPGEVELTVSPRTVLYDVGQPLSIDHNEMKRRGCRVHRAGLARWPEPLRFSFTDVAQLPRGTSLGCFAEGLLLTRYDPGAAPQTADGRSRRNRPSRRVRPARRCRADPGVIFITEGLNHETVPERRLLAPSRRSR